MGEQLTRTYPEFMVALDIRVGQERKHIGKVGVMPIRGGYDGLAGKRVLYKEVPQHEIWSYRAKRYSIDRLAFDFAAERLGAAWLVVYLLDAQALIVVSAEVVQSSPVTDFGERPQYRIDPSSCHSIERASRLGMGYTNVEWVVDDILARDGVSLPVSRKQSATLFDW